MHDPAIRSQAAPVREWQPDLPAGTLRAVILHWTGGDYQTTFAAYHYCLSGASDVTVHAVRDLRANMRELRAGDPQEYAAHTSGRNSYAAGVAICAMQAATPHDFGSYPLTPYQIDALCVVTARLVGRYAIALAEVRTHAECAVADGYFGASDDDVRWDIARLEASPRALHPDEALTVGDRLRGRIAELCSAVP